MNPVGERQQGIGRLRVSITAAERPGSDGCENGAQLEELLDGAKSLQTSAASRTAIIHVVDDDQPFTTGICRLLKACGYTVRGYFNAGDFLMAEIPDTPGCILMDVCLPGPSGLELQASLAGRPVSLPIIFLSGHADVPMSVRAMKGGAMDFLTKPVDRETLLVAVQNAIARSIENRTLREQLREQRARYQRLTKRELEVFERVVAGKMNKEIASELGAAERTIKAHRAQVMQKMRVSSVAELVHVADQLASCPAPGTASA
jgi:FixJ family two-component response regulator